MTPTVKIHPLAEIIACKLFSIETVPSKEQRRMVTRAVKSAVEYHDEALTLERQRTIGQVCEWLIKPMTTVMSHYDLADLIEKQFGGKSA